MIEEPAEHHRRSIGLPGYDYSAPGSYFITICAHGRQCIFGEVVDGEMRLNEVGKIVWEVWNSLPARYPQIVLGVAVVMPNHFHAIITIDDPAEPVGAIHELPLRGPSSQRELPLRGSPEHELRQRDADDAPEISDRIRRRKMLLPMAVGYLKMNSAKQINHLLNSAGNPVWQRNYFEHIIMTEKEYLAIEAYIENNPANWVGDSLYAP